MRMSATLFSPGLFRAIMQTRLNDSYPIDAYFG